MKFKIPLQHLPCVCIPGSHFPGRPLRLGVYVNFFLPFFFFSPVKEKVFIIIHYKAGLLEKTSITSQESTLNPPQSQLPFSFLSCLWNMTAGERQTKWRVPLLFLFFLWHLFVSVYMCARMHTLLGTHVPLHTNGSTERCGGVGCLFYSTGTKAQTQIIGLGGSASACEAILSPFLLFL